MTTVFHAATGVVGNVGNKLQHTTSRVGSRLQVTTNRLVPPEQRKEMYKRLHLFATHNPKLAAFLATQIALTGIPFLIFLAFATATLLFSLITCLLLGLIAALAFTFFAVGFALLLLVPTIFIASCLATFIFIWGLVGYVVLRRLNQGEALDKRGTKVGDKLQGLKDGSVGASGLGEGKRTEGRIAGQRAIPSYQTYPTEDAVESNRNDDDSRDSLQGHGATVNGIDDTNEWEEKWRNGVKEEAEQLETSNPEHVLSAADSPTT